MPITLELALLLFRSHRLFVLPNKSVGLNIVAITAGVTFLAFALAIYDSYRDRVERIIFSLTPQVALKSIATDEDGSVIASGEKARCQTVCRSPFAVYQDNANKDAPKFAALSNTQLSAVDKWLSDNTSEISISWVLFEELASRIAVTDAYSGRKTRYQLLGIKRKSGSKYAPHVDLTFEGEAVRRQFAVGEGVLISAALSQQITSRTGKSATDGYSIRFINDAGTVDVRVIGVHRLGIHSISRNLIIAPYHIAANLLGRDEGTAPSYIGFTLKDANAADVLASRLRSDLRPEDMTALAWTSVSDLFDQLALYRSIIVIALSLSIVVTAINTIVNMNILIMQRAQHIGILKAIGLPPSKLIWVFVLVGVIQSLIGTTIGYGLGLASGYLLNDYINSLIENFVPIEKAEIVADPIVFAMLFAIVSVVSVLACLISARRAVRLDIAENLRSS